MKSSRAVFVVLAPVLVSAVLLASRPADGQSPYGAENAQPPANSIWGHVTRPGAADPELAKLLDDEAGSEQEAAALVEVYSRTDDEGQRGKLKAKLLAILEKQFDLQQKRRDLELARAEAQVKKVRELLRKRADGRQTIIDKRLDQLLREADGLGWTSPSGLQPHPNRAVRGANNTLSVSQPK